MTAELDERRSVSFRAVAIALLLIPFNSYWIYMAESIKYTGHPTCMSFFYNAVTILVLMLGLNRLVKRVSPGRAFSRGEILTVYVMVALGSVPASHDMLQILIPGMVYPQLAGAPGDLWWQEYVARVPWWLSVQGNAAKGFVAGGESLYNVGVIRAWLIPACAWIAFLVTLLFVMSCLAVLLRKQWTENEKLTFPIAQVPLEMTSEKSALWKSRFLWAGLAVAVLFDTFQGLSVLFPTIPYLGLKTVDLQAGIASRPWSAVGWFPLRIYPFVIGLGAIIPVELSFSMWFFYLFTKLQLIGSAALGYDYLVPRFPFLSEQSFGALLGIFGLALWSGRKYWLSLLRALARGDDTAGDPEERTRHRFAAVGVVFGALALSLFVRLLGMSMWLIVVFFAVFFAMCIAQTRMRAELGPPVHDFFAVGPDTMVVAVVGIPSLGTANLVALANLYWFNRAYRSLAMPIQLEALRMADQAKMNYRRLFWAMTLAVTIGAIAAFWSQLHVAYKIGAYAQGVSPRWFAAEPYNRLNSWLTVPAGPNFAVTAASVAGFFFAVALHAARMKLAWFPFYPAGYALSGNWSMNLLWFSLLIAWASKFALLRYGGLRLYRAALPFFLGLLLGEFLMGSFWSIFGILTGIQTYNIFP